MPRPILPLILSLTIAQSALALPHTATQLERIASINVRVADLDLQDDADVQVLLGRLERAAIKACGGNPRFHASYDLMPRHTTEVFRKCRHDAIARAVATIDAPKVSVAFEAASKRAAEDQWAHMTHSSDATPKAGT
jgi:UrcA family protein